ncbi:hypothetical protein EPO17_03290 [Patescibacteria group bacterium]|nr:MAG: hypothetical protein EPO17_03290 [Patescibacteria group bacterium]
MKLQIVLQCHDKKTGKYYQMLLEADSEGFPLQEGNTLRIVNTGLSSSYCVRIERVMRDVDDTGKPGHLTLGFFPTILVTPETPGSAHELSRHWQELEPARFLFH